ncbi:sphingomyelin phosphodiesterase 4-like, partial [Hyalella azteca]|uniref:Sphingomyelin phosphodiesterase 4-like n=1 Tax=Hyalella azteca TaxID=294128 RepID=A0A8B7PHQ8_HYAAZ
MTSSSPLPTLAQVCQGPLAWRVQSATRLLQECSSKEAGAALRTLVQSVFGAGGPAEPGMLGWGLQHFTKSQHPAEFQLLCDFLSARGPLVSMALRHAHDTFMIFEFPVTALPTVSGLSGMLLNLRVEWEPLPSACHNLLQSHSHKVQNKKQKLEDRGCQVAQ